MLYSKLAVDDARVDVTKNSALRNRIVWPCYNPVPSRSVLIVEHVQSITEYLLITVEVKRHAVNVVGSGGIDGVEVAIGEKSATAEDVTPAAGAVHHHVVQIEHLR